MLTKQDPGKGKLLIYGATGHTGKMICQEAIKCGLNFEIAGRNRRKLLALSQQLSVPFHVFSVEDKTEWSKALAEKTCLLNIAGPFSETAEMAMQACITNGVHYVDITAEVDIYRLAESRNAAAVAAGIMILPGAGLFSTYDPLVVHTAKRVEAPAALRTAFQYSGGFTPGSIASSANIINAGVLVRKNGSIQRLDHSTPANFDFGEGPMECLPTPLGGVVLCYRSTGIPDIEEYFQMKLPVADGEQAQKPIQDGQEQADLWEAPSKILVEITGADGDKVKSLAIMQAGYMPTVKAAIQVASRVLHGSFKTGFQSPASVYGEELLQDLDVRIVDL
ncbi:membrane protein [Dyadobacter endophyticus]|uniref:Membrane protein n=1 Tax=Dyadobacter endophyticus TaxID=1749036 RepID=A0ABQ1YI91_9BACT|nr:saccharopine dehydrogenase NADP-binding domain-containing protein [Dyadobacter endophyticus]GGH26893.1 membrane protein [Dyadobacter endophyticus]